MPLPYNAETLKNKIFRGSYVTKLFAKNIFLCEIKTPVYLKLEITKKINFRCIIEKLHFLLSILFAHFIP